MIVAYGCNVRNRTFECVLNEWEKSKKKKYTTAELESHKNDIEQVQHSLAAKYSKPSRILNHHTMAVSIIE